MLYTKYKEYLIYLGYLLIGLIIFGIGYFYGYKNTSKPNDIVINSPNLEEASYQEAIEVEGVYWIHPGQEPVCPDTHKIKGTYTSDIGFFYDFENPRYDRIKPDICFATKEFARDKAGFIQKF